MQPVAISSVTRDDMYSGWILADGRFCGMNECEIDGGQVTNWSAVN